MSRWISSVNAGYCDAHTGIFAMEIGFRKCGQKSICDGGNRHENSDMSASVVEVVRRIGCEVHQDECAGIWGHGHQICFSRFFVSEILYLVSYGVLLAGLGG